MYISKWFSETKAIPTSFHLNRLLILQWHWSNVPLTQFYVIVKHHSMSLSLHATMMLLSNGTVKSLHLNCSIAALCAVSVQQIYNMYRTSLCEDQSEKSPMQCCHSNISNAHHPIREALHTGCASERKESKIIMSYSWERERERSLRRRHWFQMKEGGGTTKVERRGACSPWRCSGWCLHFNTDLVSALQDQGVGHWSTPREEWKSGAGCVCVRVSTVCKWP